MSPGSQFGHHTTKVIVEVDLGRNQILSHSVFAIEKSHTGVVTRGFNAQDLHLSSPLSVSQIFSRKLEEALVAVPDLIEALEAIANIDYDTGDNELALATARRCLELDDESLRCLAVAANAASSLGDTEAQAAYLATYQELNPDDPATVFNQAVVFLNKMDDEGARPLLEQCLSVDPEFAKCLFEYGMVLLRSGDLEGAKAQLEKYLAVAPDGPDTTAAAETVKYL